MASGAFASGKSGKVTVGGLDLKIKNWSHDEVGKVVDVTNTGSGGVEESLVTTVKYSGQFVMDWDLNAQPTDEAPGLYPGKRVALLEYISSEQCYSFTEVEIQTCKPTSDVGGVVGFTVTWQAQVAPTYPGTTEYSESSSGSSSSASESSSSSLAG